MWWLSIPLAKKNQNLPRVQNVSGFGADSSMVQQPNSFPPVLSSACHLGRHRAPIFFCAYVPQCPARRRCPCAATRLQPGVDALQVGWRRDATGAALFFCGENWCPCSIICLLAALKGVIKFTGTDCFPTVALPKHLGHEKTQTQGKIQFIFAWYFAFASLEEWEWGPDKHSAVNLGGLLRQPLRAHHLRSHLCLRLSQSLELPGNSASASCLLQALTSSVLMKALAKLSPNWHFPVRAAALQSGGAWLFLRPFLMAMVWICPPALEKCLWTLMEPLPEHRTKSWPHHRVHLIPGTCSSGKGREGSQQWC